MLESLRETVMLIIKYEDNRIAYKIIWQCPGQLTYFEGHIRLIIETHTRT